jgi:DNA polymerase III subunit epsilon
MKILFFDTETTGLPRNWNAPFTDTNNWPRMVQLAFQQYDFSGNQILENNLIIKPTGFTIPLQASKIHRITTERANQEGEELQEVLEIFHTLVEDSTLLVAHNISFDMNIVGAEFHRAGLDTKLFFKKRRFCTMKDTISRYEKWPKLSELHYKLFNKHFEEAHDAGVDVNITVKCFWELVKLGKVSL